MPNKFTPVLIASAIIIVISSIPLLQAVNILCCSGVMAGGFFGTMYYASKMKQAGLQMQFKDSAAIGILSGIISAIVVTIISTLIQMLLKQNPIPEIFHALDSGGFTIPPEFEKILQDISKEYNDHGFSKTLTLIAFASNIVSYPVFSTVGALIAAAIFSKRKTDTGIVEQ